jgi:putative transcriptional regulator
LGYDGAMSSSSYFNDQFLIAMPALQDPNFSRSVTYVCQHNDSGALGITINRRSELSVGDVLQQLKVDADDSEWAQQPVLIGGPVHPDRGFVLHSREGEWNSTFEVNEHIALTTSRDILVALADGKGPEKAILTLGYAGWSSGQLESEMLQNTWLSTDADLSIIFDTPLASRWEKAADTIGINIQSMSGLSGHA